MTSSASSLAASRAPLEIRHFFTYFRDLGGVQSLLRQHLAEDARRGADSRVAIFLDPLGCEHPNVFTAGMSGRDSVLSARRKYAQRVEPRPASAAVYHNFWGLPMFADLDQSARRLALFHSDWPGVERALQAQAGLTDGIMCVNEPLKRQLREHLPEMPEDRLLVLPLPIDPPAPAPVRAPLRGRTLVCGYSGRVSILQKRLDFLPEFCQRLDEAGVDYRFEALGDGSLLSTLERKLGGHPRVRLHGRKSGAEYWSIIRQWDVNISFSQYEGLPLSLLETLHQGSIPIFPRIQSGGDVYVEKVSPRLLYTFGRMDEAAAVLQWIAGLPEEAVQDLRQRSMSLTEPHLRGSYFDKFSGFVADIARRPRISIHRWQRRPCYFSDFLPFFLLSRVCVPGFYKRAPAAV